MPSFCVKCGSPFSEGQAFCAVCGERRNEPVSAEPQKQFCTGCGALLTGSSTFCTKCGTAVAVQSRGTAPAASAAVGAAAAASSAPVIQGSGMSSAAATPQVAMPGIAATPAANAGTQSWSTAPAASVAAAPAPAQQKKSPLAKILVAVVGLFALFLIGITGTCFYVGYRVKKKAEQVEQAYKQASQGQTAGASGQGQPDANPDMGKLLGAISQGLSQAKSGNPDMAKMMGAIGEALQTTQGGPTETRPAGSCPTGDQASFDAYLKAAAAATIPFEPGMTLTSIWTPGNSRQDIETIKTVKSIQGNTVEAGAMRLQENQPPGARTLCIADLLSAREYETGWGSNNPQTIPGATMFSVSRAIFSDLKAGQPAAFTYYEALNRPGGYALQALSKGTLSRVEPSDVPYSIIVNGDSKQLPVIHARGQLGKDTFEARVLDDPANPLVLDFADVSGTFRIAYVKITFPVKKEVEQQLAQTGRAEIYGIYFDFNKDTPRPESAPVLKEIAQALKDNPGWKLEIGGHTDNVGGDDYNLNLSQQRAQSVMQSLTTQYGIAADRLTAHGYGASQPKATNDTVEGRALNRRVELVRQ